ncbi:MAG: M55 family metallopeptidase [Oscillospiraceae bacterium]|nr:M55 family metallopeptidase [Oscillospiraceae bacterium]
MKIFIMTDMEGVAGMVNALDWTHPEGCYYEAGKRLLTMEINAAIEGFFNAGATEILVADGHGAGGINVELLDNRVMYQRGWNGPYPFGNDSSFDAIAWIGQHPKAGTEYGHICHTGSFHVIERKINGVSVGELGEEVVVSMELGVTPIFASGCLALTKEAEAIVPGIQTAVVKFGVTPGSGDECNVEKYAARNLGAVHYHPEKAREIIKKNAYDALTRFKTHPETFKLPDIKAPYTLEMVTRPEGDGKSVKYRVTHPTSIIDLLNGKGETTYEE